MIDKLKEFGYDELLIKWINDHSKYFSKIDSTSDMIKLDEYVIGYQSIKELKVLVKLIGYKFVFTKEYIEIKR